MKRASGRTVGCEAADSINMAHVLMLLSQNGAERASTNLVQYYPANEERVFECKTCKRQFPSFQALGGHRASHKKPRIGTEDCTDQNGGALFAKPKLHECSICGLEFSIGQALGGHMRRHRQIGNEGFSVQHGILDINKSTRGENGDNGLFHAEMKMPLTDQGEMACKKDRQLVTLNLFL